MKYKKEIVLFPIGISISLIIVNNVSTIPRGFPLAAFAVFFTFLMAAIAIPEVVVGLSTSHIGKNLIPEFYKSLKHWLFLSYQANIALISIIIAHTEADSDISSFFSRLLLFLIVFDFFYGFIYLDAIRHLIASPSYMLNIYLDRIKKILKKGSKNRKVAFLFEIQNIERIARYTNMCYEKTEILKKVEELFEIVTNRDVPKALRQTARKKWKFESKKLIATTIVDSCAIIPDLKDACIEFFYDVIDNSKNQIQIIPTKMQFDSLRLLVDCIVSSCTIQNELHSASKKNISEALEILYKAWIALIKWGKGDFDYAVFTRAIKNIALFAIQKNYYYCIEKSLKILNDIALKSISDFPNNPRDLFRVYLSPFDVASDISEIGISATNSKENSLTTQSILYLLHFYSIDKNKMYLFYTLNLMSFIWDKNKDATLDLGNHLIDIEEDEIESTVEYGSICFLRETVRIKRFLDSRDQNSTS